ncbi:MAG: hypothetical protein CME38_13225 [Haliea sp.]|nr:hypothetical protein [Haliea sp.]|tara:strand:+ start:578 stop:1537 length:960 start_codon:yes stop_codon:yes gene_type:complete
MKSRSQPRIHRAREALQNPYAFIDDDSMACCDEHDSICSEATSSPARKTRQLLQDPYAGLNGHGTFEWEQTNTHTQYQSLNLDEVLRDELIPGTNHNASQIEDFVISFQRKLWTKRGEIFGERRVDPLALLDPELILTRMGYSLELDEGLGQYSEGGEMFEVAGLLDRENRRVKLSRQYSPEIRNFTGAHELGHVLLHEGTGLHRDRPLDNKSVNGQRDYRERQADLFATYFLMPTKQVRREFYKRFLAAPFVASVDALSALGRADREAFSNAASSEDRAKVFAAAQSYNGSYFESLSSVFKVSRKAMTFRLMELSLVP